MLRSATPTAIAQEINALLTAYQVLRVAISDATLTANADRASFGVAVHTARDQVVRDAEVIAAETFDLVANNPRAGPTWPASCS